MKLAAVAAVVVAGTLMPGAMTFRSSPWFAARAPELWSGIRPLSQ